MAGEEDIWRALEDAEDAGLPEDRPVSDLDRTCARFLANDIGNADRLLARHGEDLAHRNGWLAWVGTHWDPVGGAHIAQLKAQLTARALYAEPKAIAPPDPDKVSARAERDGINLKDAMKAAQKAYDELIASRYRFAKSSGNSGKIAAMLKEAEPHARRRPDLFDANPMAFNAANGTLHLVEGQVVRKPHHRGDLITKLGGCAHDPKATCPTFEAFLERVQPDAEPRAYLQRVAGYLLVGDRSEQIVVLMQGKGRNGKGTLMNVLRHVLGTYAVSVGIETFGEATRRDGGGPSPDVARLEGARFAPTSDTPDNFALSAGMVKQATGQEPMTARELHKGIVEFVVRALVMIPCNDPPIIRGQDDGIWRRVHLLKWPVQIPESEIDPHLGDKLAAELPGILNWMLAGLVAWRQKGLAPPESVRLAVQAYRQDSDPIGEFLDIWTAPDPKRRASGKALWDKYEDYRKANGLPESSQVKFGKALKKRGLESTKMGGLKYWLGIVLRDEPRDDVPAAASAGDDDDRSGYPPNVRFIDTPDPDDGLAGHGDGGETHRPDGPSSEGAGGDDLDEWLGREWD